MNKILLIDWLLFYNRPYEWAIIEKIENENQRIVSFRRSDPKPGNEKFVLPHKKMIVIK